MQEKTIIVEIDDHGNSSVDLVGFHGKGCGDVAKILRGDDAVRASQTKPEFHVQDKEQVRKVNARARP